jgi:hypothetical protein
MLQNRAFCAWRIGGGAASVAAVGLADGSAQFLITTGNGGVYHNIRNANSSRQGWRELLNAGS